MYEKESSSWHRNTCDELIRGGIEQVEPDACLGEAYMTQFRVGGPIEAHSTIDGAMLSGQQS